MKYGYARVSPGGKSESVDAQAPQLTKAGCKKVFRDVHVSGAKTDRAQLRRVLDQLAPGDVLMVTRLDRLARSTRDLLNTIAAIADRKAGFRSLGDAWADTTTSQRAANADRFRRPCRVRARPDPGAHGRRPRAGQGAGREAWAQAEAHRPSAAGSTAAEGER